MAAPRGDRLIEAGIRLSAGLVISSLALIFIFVGKEALPLLLEPGRYPTASLSRLLLPQAGEYGFSWQPVSSTPQFSLLPLLVGTLKVTLVALLVALPVALAAAVFSTEFAPVWLREVIKPVIELLAGIPSVVLGFFALMVLASWLQELFGFTYRLNAISAGIAMSLAVIPIVYTVTEDALTSVPQTFRDGSLALGANTWQTAWRVVLPAASPGIFAACVLGFGRAFGETMIVLMASGNAPLLTLNPAMSVRTLSATVAAELAEVVVGSAHYRVLFAIGAMLFMLTFLSNFFGHWAVGRLRRRLQGG
jgi:phosphate transport system permease protein